MEKISKEFVGRTARAVLFIVLVIISCAGISTAGLFLASRFGLTQSREQVTLTALSIGTEGEVELPQRGRVTEGDGWTLRNSRDIYTLTLDNAMIEGDGQGAESHKGAAQVHDNAKERENIEVPQPAITITGDLILELKEGGSSWIRSEGAGIIIRSGTLVIRGGGGLSIESGSAGILGLWKGQEQQEQAAVRLEGGQLDIRGKGEGINCRDVELAGSRGQVRARDKEGIGIYALNVNVEAAKADITVGGNAAALVAGSLTAGSLPASGANKIKPSIRMDKKVQVIPENVQITELENVAYHGAGTGEILTYATEEMVIYNDETSCFDGAAKEITFIGK